MTYIGIDAAKKGWVVSTINNDHLSLSFIGNLNELTFKIKTYDFSKED